jgi:xanthine phosphoribosyltransferase
VKQYYPYEEFKKDTNALIRELKDFEPEAIVGVARGGLTLSHALAEGMDLREVQTLRTELYDDSCKREELTLFDSCDFVGKKRVVVVDDIADSGETLSIIMKHLEEKFQDVEFKSATLFYKKSSVYEPHFWINEANAWIEFFWEKDFL